MPKLDDFPLVAQGADRGGEEPKSGGFLKRLAGFGRSEAVDEYQAMESVQPAPAAVQDPVVSLERQKDNMVDALSTAGDIMREKEATVSPAQPAQPEQPAPANDTEPDDEQLEIPAFLRRQAN